MAIIRQILASIGIQVWHVAPSYWNILSGYLKSLDYVDKPIDDLEVNIFRVIADIPTAPAVKIVCLHVVIRSITLLPIFSSKFH